MKLRSRTARYLVTRLARAYGFLDPVAVLSRLRGFAQHSEVGEPIELLRAGMLFHARGLVNTKAIQHNLDWVWPYWVERQFNPDDPSFIPRAFSFSHINLTHRNWTAVGLPDIPYYPIVDPRGLVTPTFDGWSIDFWFVPDSGEPLFPSKLGAFEQELHHGENLVVHSTARSGALELASDVQMNLDDHLPICRARVRLAHAPAGHVAIALRPYNPEGVSFIEDIRLLPGGRGLLIDKRHELLFSRPPSRVLLSTYADGDVSLQLGSAGGRVHVRCQAGMATAAALFPSGDFNSAPLEVRSPIYDELKPDKRPDVRHGTTWPVALDRLARLRIPDERLARLYEQARTGVILHSPGEVYPGPYTYKRFWFRDAVFILHALLTLGDVERVRRSLAEFAPRQRHDGFFLSQDGEWDSNGEALWMYGRFARLAGEDLPPDWMKAVRKGADWIRRKRIPAGGPRREAGLLPAGFSAEHLGPNDFYYWDDFWAVAGLRAAAALFEETDAAKAHGWNCEAEDLMRCIERSLPAENRRRFPGAIPASPYRRMDSGAVGSIVADYPLQIFPAADRRMLLTINYLRHHSFCRGVFLQDMIHSGLNIYLTIHIAQVLLRAGDARAAWPLMDRVADLASPTGQWPEAIHPRTGGGCMGDGEHIWAAAEWLMLLRNLCVREERDSLVFGAGVRHEWLDQGCVELEPTLTPHGSVGVRFEREREGVRVQLTAAWRHGAPTLEFAVPGCEPLSVPAGDERDEFILPHRA